VVNLARSLGLDSESALHAATEKFENRFRHMEASLPSDRKFQELSFEEMDALWDEAKKRLKTEG
jgi:uncharacterized protein YabN with tetrapyrrole methylase and pyrophosphatase domain